MKEIEKLEKKKLEIENKIKMLKDKELKKDFIEVKSFRIYKWSKPIKDFVIPKGFRLAEEREFVDLYDSGFKIEEYPVLYFTKNRSKLNIKNGLSLSGLFLNRGLYLDSNNINLAYSNDNGRVVLKRIGEDLK